MTDFAFIFPGQASQSVGMLSELASAYEVVTDTYAEASDELGYDLWQITQSDETKLNQTQYTQPALLAASVAIWRVWQSLTSVTPTVLAGHSLGEYSALVVAEAITYRDAVNLVAERGRLMQAAVNDGEGSMAAILGLDDELVVELCDNASQGEVVSAVNYNAPGQVVIAGETTAVNRAIEFAKEMGAKRAMLLPVSVPSHCLLMKPAADQLAIRLADTEISPPKKTVFHNIDATSQTDPEAIREKLYKQLFSPVQWVKTITQLQPNYIETVFECGPGKVLTGLVKRIDKSLSAYAINTPESLQQAIELVAD